MKSLLLTVCLLFVALFSNAQYSWRLRPCLPGAPRTATASFSVGNKGYVICGFTAAALNGISEVWEFDDATNAWTQKNNFPSARSGPAVFVINDTAYAGEGLNSSGYLTDFYRYDATNDVWIPLANFPGTPRYFSMTFSINGKGYLGCGKGNTQYVDFFEYDPQANSWTQKASFPGTARQNGFGVSVGQYGYIGVGYNGGMEADAYRYDPAADTWSPIANFGGGARYGVGYFVILDTFYVVAGRDPYHDDCYRYDITTNTWVQQSSFTCLAPPRAAACGFTINGHGYTCTGDLGNGVYTNDFLEFGLTDVRFTQRIHVLGNDTSYCGNFSRLLSTGNPCTLWSTGVTASQIIVNTNGTYWARIPDTCGMLSDTITIHAGLPPVGFGGDTTLCVGQTIILNAQQANVTYHWQDNSSGATYTVSSPGNYSVTVSSATGCSASSSINVNYINLAPIVNLGNDTTFCGSFIQPLSTGVMNTYWSTGATDSSIQINTPGVYWAEATNACGTTTDSITFQEIAAPVISINPILPICSGDSVNLQLNTTASNIFWSNGDITSSIYVHQSGIYWVETWNTPSCRSRDTATVLQGTPPVFGLGSDTTICGGNGIVLKANVSNAQYRWQDGSTDSIYTVISSGTYGVTVTNNCGSSNSKISIDLHIDECALYLPTGFSPNGDGKNDIFRAISHCPVDKFAMHVYNRWGELVFESNDIAIGWDGTFKERPQALDVFVYYIEYFNYCKGGMDKKSGNVTLLK